LFLTILVIGLTCARAVSELSTEDVLAGAARNSALRHKIAYTSTREYLIKNLRFGKSAEVGVRVISEPGRGKQLTVANSSGSTKLIHVIETLLSSEADESKPGRAGSHEIGPSNYRATIRGSATVAGRECWVLSLIPKVKSKYLVNGTVWIEKSSYGLVRLDGDTAASVSVWVGKPHVVEDFAPIHGVWMAIHTVSKSNSFLLGESELEIQYSNYELGGSGGRR
jgi:hypothetical protein